MKSKIIVKYTEIQLKLSCYDNSVCFIAITTYSYLVCGIVWLPFNEVRASLKLIRVQYRKNIENRVKIYFPGLVFLFIWNTVAKVFQIVLCWSVFTYICQHSWYNITVIVGINKIDLMLRRKKKVVCFP